MATPEKKLFKDWFDRKAAVQLSEQIAAVYPRFDREAFVRKASTGLEKLEMSGRVARFSSALADTLPENKEKALTLLTDSLPEVLPDTERVTDGWLQWPLGKFIADHGLPFFETSMEAMTELTQRFSAEFAVRPFMEHRQKETLRYLGKRTGHRSPHVRRWCSEGTRPLLPWGKKLTSLVNDPSPVWPILEDLKDDPCRYVQKSVANHLNDISRHHPGTVVSRCAAWSENTTEPREWIIRHALRTLIKDGHPDALRIRGFSPPVQLETHLVCSPGRVSVGNRLEMVLTMKNRASGLQNLLVDYAVVYVRQNGKTGRKVFKWTEKQLPPGGSVLLEKTHSFRETRVRALYPGRHRIELLINGQVLAESSFQLMKGAAVSIPDPSVPF